MYLILVLQFGSFLDPFAIMLSLPLSLIGVVLALLVTGDTLNIMSLIGVILLFGIVAKNAILLIDFAKWAQEERGISIRDALIEAGRIRLRPIVMTSVAIVAGMIPVALGARRGRRLPRAARARGDRRRHHLDASSRCSSSRPSTRSMYGARVWARARLARLFRAGGGARRRAAAAPRRRATGDAARLARVRAIASAPGAGDPVRGATRRAAYAENLPQSRGHLLADAWRAARARRASDDRWPPAPQFSSCALSRNISMKEALRVWQSFYCEGAFARCERFKLATAGREVPDRLLPNGRLAGRHPSAAPAVPAAERSPRSAAGAGLGASPRTPLDRRAPRAARGARAWPHMPCTPPPGGVEAEQR